MTQDSDTRRRINRVVWECNGLPNEEAIPLNRSKDRYRAWHEGKKRMFSPEEMGRDQLTLSVDGRGLINVSGDSHDKSIFTTWMIPLQTLAITDVKGVEVFDGDIVLSDGGQIRTVGWYDQEACMSATVWRHYPDDALGHSLGVRFLKDWEVVGNIYEHPERVVSLGEGL